ncbi:unnamed protein product [Parajaminaea phylloscopi]
MSWPIYIAALASTAPLICVAFLFSPVLFGLVRRFVAAEILGNDLYRNIPQPPFPSVWSAPIVGHIPVIKAAEPAAAHLAWARELNSFVYVYRALFYVPRLLIADPKGVMHILSQQNAYDFPKPVETRKFLLALLGNGLVTAEGEAHKKQRKITAPAFTVSTVRAFVPVFFKHAQSLVRAVDNMIDQTEGPSLKPFLPGQSSYSAKASATHAPVIDVGYWLGKTTLDIIGEIGFGYDFKSMESVETGTSEESLSTVFSTLLSKMADTTLADFLRMYVRNNSGLGWIDRLFPQPARITQMTSLGDLVATHARAIIDAKNKQLEAEMRAIGLSEKDGFSKAVFDEDLDVKSLDGQVRSKDLLHMTMRANMATDLRASERLSDDELLGQMTSFLIAGHETTATQTLWALYVLAGHPQVVAKLRAEIEEHFGPDVDEAAGGKSRVPTVDFDTLQNMTYLDAVCKEMMRLHSPVTATARFATKDAVIPLGRAYPTRDGKGTFDKVPVFKGQDIFIPIQVLNSSTDIWGPTAGEFDPSRWEEGNMPAAAKESGLPSQLMTFITGPRGCIGQRAAVAEFKVILSCLIREFDWHRVHGWEIERKQGIVTRAIIKGQRDVGLQMPLRVTRAKRGQQGSFSPDYTPQVPTDRI